MPLLPGTAIVGSVPVNGAIIDAWDVSRTWPAGQPPALNALPPTGSPDAGPVTSGTAFGGEGAFQINVPTTDAYYLRVQFGGSVGWALAQPPGSGAVDSVTAANSSIVIAGTAANPTVAVGMLPAGVFATPAIVLGTTAASGVASTAIQSDATIVAFDTTVPVTQAANDVAATGSAVVAARRDHRHGMPSLGVTWPLTNSADETFQPNSIVNNTLTLHNATSAVNGITVTGSASGTPTIVSQSTADGIRVTSGGDITYQPSGVANAVLTLHNNASANGGLSITGQATSAAVVIGSSRDIVLQPSGVANSALLVRNTGASPSTGVIIQCNGAAPGITTSTGSNKDLLLQADSGTVSTGGNQFTLAGGRLRGLNECAANNTFGITFEDNNLNPLFFISGSGTVNYLTANGVASANGYATLSADGPSTNVDVNITGKGTGTPRFPVGFKTKAITSGALPTVTVTSGTAFQTLTTRDTSLVLAITATLAAGTATIALSPDNVTFSTLGVSTPGTVSSIDLVTVPVPAGWWVKVTLSNATVTATYW